MKTRRIVIDVLCTSSVVLCILSFLFFFAGCTAKKKDIGTQDFPSKPITVICPWSQGGGTDAILRAFCVALQKQLGIQVVVQNITGGSSAVGHKAIKDAVPDGYTMGMITFELNSLYAQGSIDFSYKDFDPMIRINADAATLSTRYDAPYNTVEEFVDYCKKNPAKVTVGNSAPGSVWHIGAGLFADKAGIKIKHEAFEGAAGAVSALVTGYVDAVSVSFPEVKSQLDKGYVKVLGTMAEHAPASYPQIKTFKEQGYDIVYSTWRGIALPKGVPPAIREILAQAFKKAQEDEDFVATAKKLNLELAYLEADDFASFLEENYLDVSNTMKSIGLIN